MKIEPFNNISDPKTAVILSGENFSVDADGICSINLYKLEYEVANAMLLSLYYPSQSVLLKATQVIDNEVEWIGWCWLARGERCYHSDEEMASYRYIHLDLDISARKRIEIIKEFIRIGELWCKTYSIPLLVSTTIRKQQDTFLKLHKRLGFTCLGSNCYKRIDNTEHN